MSCEAPIDKLFSFEQLSEQDFDQQMDLAEDVLTQLASSRNNNAAVWMNDMNQRGGFSLASVFTGGKAEQFAAHRTVSRLNEMQSDLYWNSK